MKAASRITARIAAAAYHIRYAEIAAGPALDGGGRGVRRDGVVGDLRRAAAPAVRLRPPPRSGGERVPALPRALRPAPSSRRSPAARRLLLVPPRSRRRPPPEGGRAHRSARRVAGRSGAGGKGQGTTMTQVRRFEGSKVRRSTTERSKVKGERVKGRRDTPPSGVRFR